MTTERTTIKSLEPNFASIITEVAGADQEKKDFITKWTNKILAVIALLKENGKIAESINLNKELREWIKHPDHGISHCYSLLQGASYLLADDDSGQEVDKEVLELAIVGHDFAQMLPAIDFKTGEKNESLGDMRLQHELHIAQLIYLFGDELDLVKGHDRRKLISALRFHDFDYKLKPNDERYKKLVDFYQNYPVGAILHDADRLFGAGFFLKPEQLAGDSLERNITNGRGKNGWYICRNDLNGEQINKWQYGDRWFSSGTAAVGSEIYQTPYFTAKAKKLGQAKQDYFPQVAEQVYGSLYNKTADQILKWKEAVAQGQAVGVQLTGKEQAPQKIEQVENIVDFMQEVYNRPLKLPSKYKRDYYHEDDARGFMVVITIPEQEEIIIDPSVGKYAAKNDKIGFLRAVMNNINAWKTE